MTISRLRPAIAVLAAMSLATIATIAQADPAGKWRVEFSDRADNDGVLTLASSTLTGLQVKIKRD